MSFFKYVAFFFSFKSKMSENFLINKWFLKNRALVRYMGIKSLGDEQINRQQIVNVFLPTNNRK